MYRCVHNVECVLVTKYVFIVHYVYWVYVCVFLHIVFSTVCKYRYCLYVNCCCFFALSGARSQEFHSPRHLCCGDVTIKVILFDLNSVQVLSICNTMSITISNPEVTVEPNPGDWNREKHLARNLGETSSHEHRLNEHRWCDYDFRQHH